LLAAGGILVLPSSHEGTPNVLMEAMSHGVPCVVASGSGGGESLVGTGDRPAGRVADVESSESLAGAIGELIVDEALRRELGAAGRARVQALAWPNVRNQWLTILGLDWPITSPANATALERTTRSLRPGSADWL
jgi:glycosyltransferase involved in cell wall biosynthesis